MYDIKTKPLSSGMLSGNITLLGVVADHLCPAGSGDRLPRQTQWYCHTAYSGSFFSVICGPVVQTDVWCKVVFHNAWYNQFVNGKITVWNYKEMGESKTVVIYVDLLVTRTYTDINLNK